MMRSMQSAVTGLRAQQTAMDVIGNNIANVNTAGFKASTTTFSDLFYQTLNNGGATVDPSQVGYGAQVSGVSKNMSSVGATSTDNPTDLYIDGEGYFAVATDKTKTQPDYYTRVGNFSFSDGYLVDKTTGEYVMAYDSATSGYVPLCIDNTTLRPTGMTNNSQDVAINGTNTGTPAGTYPNGTFDALKDIAVNQDGSITATLGSTTGKLLDSNSNPIQIALCTFGNDSGLKQVGDNFYAASESSGAAVPTTAGGTNTTVLRSGELEMSNVDIAKEFTNMIVTERGFQANSRVITVSDTMLEELVNLKRQ